MRLAIALLAGMVTASSGGDIRGQSLSKVGTHLTNVFGNPMNAGTNGSFFKAMTADGKWVVFVDGWSDPCPHSAPNLSMMRTDGTGFRVIVPFSVLKTFEPNPTSNQFKIRTLIDRLVLSGDGRWLAFSWPHNNAFDFCTDIPPIYWYIVNVETGHIEEFRFNDKPVGMLTYSDDARLCFSGYRPETDSYWYHLADPDGSNAVLFLEIAPWGTVAGTISPDGSKFAFRAGLGVNKHAYVMDLATQAVVQVTPEPMDISTVHPSADTSRVVLGVGNKGARGVNGDGTDFHVIHPWGGGSVVTISRDGNHVFTTIEGDGIGGALFARFPWGGGSPIPIEGKNPNGLSFYPQPVSADGSRMAVHGMFKQGIRPWLLEGDGQLKVWHAEPPVLTTYGYGTPGKPFTWEVGGAPGQLYAVQAEVQRGSGLPGLAAALPRWATGVMLTGVVSGPDNIGSFTTTLPEFVPAGGELEILFRGWVLDPESREMLPTNETRMPFTHPAALGADAGSPSPAATAPATLTASQVAGARPPGPPSLHQDPHAEVSPEHRLWDLAVNDPHVWLQLKRDHWEGWTLEGLAITLGFSAEDVALMLATGD